MVYPSHTVLMICIYSTSPRLLPPSKSCFFCTRKTRFRLAIWTKFSKPAIPLIVLHFVFFWFECAFLHRFTLSLQSRISWAASDLTEHPTNTTTPDRLRYRIRTSDERWRLSAVNSKTQVLKMCGRISQEGALDVHESRRERRDKSCQIFRRKKRKNNAQFWADFFHFFSRIACCSRESTSTWQNFGQKRRKRRRRKFWVWDLFFKSRREHPVFSGEFSLSFRRRKTYFLCVGGV